ncbi:MAG: glycine cleavage system H protein [Desulfomonilaceae bacterium]|nr:glycine cleavage system H protein [Desulfomonilaceae bacterium]
MEFPKDRLYSEYHLWVKPEEGQVVIGITDYAKAELGDVDYVELPGEDEDLIFNEPFGIVETSKAVTDLIAPVSGTVTATNLSLGESPNTVTEDPYGAGWLVRVKMSEPAELDDLIKPLDYEKLVNQLIEE